MRKALFWLHLIAGVLAGLIIFLMSATGVLLTYEYQLTHWVDTHNYQVSASGTPRTPEALLAPLADRQPSSLTVYSDPQRPALVQVGRDQRIYLDPYTGTELGAGAPRFRAAMHTLIELHRWLGLGGPMRAWGRGITGACNLLFLFLLLSGLYLWLPRKWSKPAVRAVTVPQFPKSAKARDFNWHNVLGFWMAIPLLVVITSGAVISYGWASNLVYRLAGEEPPPRRKRSENKEARSIAGLDPLWARAATQQTGWRSLSVQIPTESDDKVRFSLDNGNGRQPHLRSALTLKRANAEIDEWTPPQAVKPGQRARAFLRFAHTGEVFGLPGQTLAGIASLAGVVLVYTGYALAWRRYRSWRKRQANASSTKINRAPERAQFTGTSSS